MSVWFAKFLAVLGQTLIGLGLTILAFAAFQLWGTGLAESRAQDRLESDFEALLAEVQAQNETQAKDPDVDEPTDTSGLAPLTPDQLPNPGDPIGILEIESVDIKKTLVEGVTRDVLRDGPGRYPDTSYPGQPGNSAFAGHRTTYGAPFFNIDKVQPGDLIKVTTLQGEFFYEIEGHEAEGKTLGYKIVSPNQTDVLEPKDYNTLTLTACHPKYSAALRLIVTAKLTSAPAPQAVIKPSTDTPAELATEDELSSNEELTESLNWQPDQLAPTILWGSIFLAVILAVILVVKKSVHRWRWYILASPVFLATMFVFFTALEKMLPAV